MKLILTDAEIYKAQYGYGNNKDFPSGVCDEVYEPLRRIAKAQIAKLRKANKVR